MDSRADSVVILEIVRGQIDNAHHTTEQLLLSRAGLLNHISFANTVIKPPPVKGRKRKVKKEKKDASSKSSWRLNETRTVLIPMSITCVDVQQQLFAVEELTQLGSIGLSLKNSCDVLIGAREVIPEEG